MKSPAGAKWKAAPERSRVTGKVATLRRRVRTIRNRDPRYFTEVIALRFSAQAWGVDAPSTGRELP
jgi:hypothetical protein